MAHPGACAVQGVSGQWTALSSRTTTDSLLHQDDERTVQSDEASMSPVTPSIARSLLSSLPKEINVTL